MIICPECGTSEQIFVDGREVTEDELSHMRYPPRRIERRLTHMRWCTKQDVLDRSVNGL